MTRVPITQTARPGERLVPLIGGPVDGDLLSLPDPLPMALNIPLLDSSADNAMTSLMTETQYQLRRVWLTRMGEPQLAARVYVHPTATEDDLNRGLIDARGRGWTP